jgi:cell division protease FtsH
MSIVHGFLANGEYMSENPDKNKKNIFGGGDNKNNSNGQNQQAKYFKNFLIWAIMISSAIAIFVMTQKTEKTEWPVSYTVYREFVESGKIYEAKIKKTQLNDFEFHGELKESAKIFIEGKNRDVKSFYTKLGLVDQKTEEMWASKGIIWTYEEGDSGWWGAILSFLPWIVLIGIYIFFLRRMQMGGGGGKNGVFSFGKSRAKMLTDAQKKITFNDVAGADEAKYELQEIIEFLKEPAKFQKLGGKIPRGVLLLGPPGTGKTLLARAVAGEANVPFFSISGADFVEMFVGVGASRVRDLFEQAKKNHPCIVFIDEIDAVGRHRGAGLGGGHDEREQTLNQLLVEMDGFEQNIGVIIIAATNRPDVLDPALLRPGRFDRQIVVDRPDVKGREGILKVHTSKIPLSPDVNIEIIAKGTPGFSGADLANIVNEAALLAARRNSENVTMYDFEMAKDKVMMGVERKSMVISDKEKEMTAYHEMGHALAGVFLPNGDPVHKVTIIPRGRALGVTSYLPTEDQHSWSKEYIETSIIRALAGRAAEIIIFNQLTTGASSDLDHATKLAKKMVCNWGMSEKLGPVKLDGAQEEVFLGREFNNNRDHSEFTAQMIDEEIRSILTIAADKAEALLRDKLDLLHKTSKILLEREVLEGEELNMIIKGEELPPMNMRKLEALKSMKISEMPTN